MDKRIQRTKTAVFGAVLELLVEKQADKITVLELCKKAEINKSTFYLHYKSLEDCLKKCFDAIMNGVVEISKQVKYDEIKQNPKPFVEHYLTELEKNSEYLTRFKESEICGQSLKILHDKLVESIAVNNGFTMENNYYEIANISFGVAGILAASITMLPNIDKPQLSKTICTMLASRKQ